MSTESSAATIAGQAAQLGAKRAGLPTEVADLIGTAVRALTDVLLTHRDPGALARDLIAEAAHKKAMMSAVQAALDAESR